MANPRTHHENLSTAIEFLAQEDTSILKKLSAIYQSPIDSKTNDDITGS